MSQLKVNSIVPSGGIPAGASGGGIIQIVTVNKEDTFSTTSTSFTDVTGLSASITPRSSSNKILCFASIIIGSTNTGADNYLRLLRGASFTVSNDFLIRTGSTSICLNYNFLRVDNPATTSSVTYKIQVKAEVNDVVINRRGSNPATEGGSTLVLMEVSG